MPLEDDAKQVKRLALEPIGRAPDRSDRRQHRQVVIRCGYPNAQALVQTDRQQMKHHAEARTVPANAFVIRIVHTTEVNQLFELATRRITQCQSHLAQCSRIDVHTQLAAGDANLQHLVSQRGRHNSL